MSAALKELATFDWAAPDYAPVWAARVKRLARLRQDARLIEAARMHYRSSGDGLADFIEQWGCTYDPRNVGTERPTIMPFILFPKQREFINFLWGQWRGQKNGVVVKSRDCGASWIAMAFAVSICLLFEGVSVGFGSQKKDKVDNRGDPDSLFYKGRMFIRYLPLEFRGDWTEAKNSADMRMVFPDSGGSITGECGDEIGRGGRKSIYFIDEFAHLERPRKVDAALVATTRCRIEISSVNGTANVFAEHARGGKWPRFDFHYRHDPRYTDLVTGMVRPAFAEFLEMLDPLVRRSEYEADFLASVDGIIIPAEWVESAVDAHLKLGITISGEKRGAFDIADEGKDKCAYVSAHGILVRHCEVWSGKGSDTFQSTLRAFALADEYGDNGFEFDQDGMGGPIRGDVNQILEARAKAHSDTRRLHTPLRISAFRGSGEVQEKDLKAPGTDRLNSDYFENFKAQCWWGLRRRFNLTYRAVIGQDKKFNASDLISLDSKIPLLDKLKAELSQPVRVWSKSGKMVIDKAPDGVPSPNMADAVMMRMGYYRALMAIPDEIFSMLQ